MCHPRYFLLSLLLAAWTSVLLPAVASTDPNPPLADKVDAIVREARDETGVPSVSLAIAGDGAIVYAKAYGNARLEPKKIAATPATRYGIGSVSKQFCAAAILLLAQDGKLRLDDPVGKYVPRLTGGDTITIRQVLNHTSGYRDYWPQDYVPDAMLRPSTAEAILDAWARRPLDFTPGTSWQYSNTNYTVAGLIVEAVSGRKLMDFLQERIFKPSGMTDVTECDTRPLAAPDAAGYTRTARGPVRPAPKEGAGWLFAAGELAMTPSDLVRWDLALGGQRLLSAGSYWEMTSVVKPTNGQPAQYALGIVNTQDGAGRQFLMHEGEISGSTTVNIFWPQLRAALAITVNANWGEVPTLLVQRLKPLLLPRAVGPDEAARAFFEALQAGHLDPATMSDNLRAFFTPQRLQDAMTGLGPLGSVRSLELQNQQERGGMTLRTYYVVCAHGTAEIIARLWPDGKFEQFNVDLAGL